MTSAHRVCVAVVISLLTIILPDTALARESGGGSLEDDLVGVWIDLHAGGTWTPPAGFHLRYSFHGPDPTCDPGEGLWRSWLYHGDEPVQGEIRGDDLFVPIPGSSGAILVGSAGGIELIPGPHRGAITHPYCAPPPIDDIDIWAEAESRLPTPNLSVNPSPLIDGTPSGITGMDLWLWFDPGAPGWDPPDTTLSVSVTESGLTATARVWVAAVEWDFGNGDTSSIGFVTIDEPGPPSVEYYRNTAGTEDDPARTYTYETKGLYDLTITVTWTGRYTLTDTAGTIIDTYTLNPYNQAQTTPYQVYEIRSTLTP